jgi:hypothetical protein
LYRQETQAAQKAARRARAALLDAPDDAAKALDQGKNARHDLEDAFIERGDLLLREPVDHLRTQIEAMMIALHARLLVRLGYDDPISSHRKGV